MHYHQVKNQIWYPCYSTTKFGLYEVKSHGHWEIEDFNMSTFMLNVSLVKTHLLCCSAHFLEHLLDMRETRCSHWVAVIVRCNKIKAGLTHKLLGLWRRKKPLVHAIVNCRVCELVIVLQLIEVMVRKSPIYPVTNPNTASSHSTHDSIDRKIVVLMVWVFKFIINTVGCRNQWFIF
jgi:hypothetical protein